jgi:hypothetical protein
MPAAVAAAIAGKAITAAIIIETVFEVAFAYSLSRISQIMANKSEGNMEPASRRITVRNTTEGRKIIYGQVRANSLLSSYAKL